MQALSWLRAHAEGTITQSWKASAMVNEHNVSHRKEALSMGSPVAEHKK